MIGLAAPGAAPRGQDGGGLPLREPLRNFQRRLADRLQAASDEAVKAAWLAVEAGGAHYLLPLAQAGEIFPAALPHPVPYTQSWFLGVASLRGTLYAVADLAGLVDRNRDGRVVPLGPRPQAQWVTLNTCLEVQCALQVDRLAGLRSAEAFAPPQAADDAAPAWWGGTYLDPSGIRWQALDLLALSQEPDFLRIGR